MTRHTVCRQCTCIYGVLLKAFLPPGKRELREAAVPQDISGISAKIQTLPITLACSVPNSHQASAKQTRPGSLLTRVYCCTFISSIQQHWMHTHPIYFNMTRQETLSSHARVGSCLLLYQTVHWIQDLLRKGTLFTWALTCKWFLHLRDGQCLHPRLGTLEKASGSAWGRCSFLGCNAGCNSAVKCPQQSACNTWEELLPTGEHAGKQKPQPAPAYCPVHQFYAFCVEIIDFRLQCQETAVICTSDLISHKPCAIT